MGVIYYKREADYDGDKTVNRSLRCEEVDGNFHFLRGYDINSITFDQKTDTLELHRVDGSVLRVNIGKPVNLNGASLDKRTGVLTLDTVEGPITVSGFLTDENIINGIKVATDSTISGDGTTNNPLRVSATEKTGTFAAADEYRDLSVGNKTLTTEDAEAEELVIGYRIVTKEKASELGRLYSFEEAKDIKAMLNENASPWRIPTKHDWDNMLNAQEPEPDCDENYRNHTSKASNVQLGHIAGKKLKSARFWEDGESGLDGFNVIPAGYINEDEGESSFRKYAAFWTATEEDDREDMFIKRFESGKDTVYQSTWDPNKRLSIRLVKDFNNGNQNESEYIDALGITVPCVQMPGVSGATVWTACNIQVDGGSSAGTWSSFTADEKAYFERDIYLINEWDGEKWIKREMVDGQSIVLRNFNDPELGEEVHYHEYMVYEISDGVYGLKDTVDILKDEFKDELDEILESVDTLEEGVSALSMTLFTEIERRTAKDDELESAIQDEADRATSAETELRAEIGRAIESIDAETTRATEAEENLDAKIDSIVASSGTEVAEVRAALNEEITRATTREGELDNEILGEQARAEAAEEDLRNDLDDLSALTLGNQVVAGDNTTNVTVNGNTKVSVKINPNSNALSLTNTGLLSKLNLTYANDKITLMANDTPVAEISTTAFTKDKLIKSVELFTVTEPGSPIPAPYIKIVWKTTEGDEVTRIPLDGLIDVYSAGNGLKLEGSVFSVKIAANSEPYLSADENGLKVTGINNAIISAPIGSVVTTITPETAADQSLLRIIEGTGRFYASNNANDVKYGQMTVSAALNALSADTVDSKQRIQTLEQKIATAETRIEALEANLLSAQTEILELESTIDGIINGDVLNNKIKDVILRLVEGYPKQIELKKYDAHNNETSVVAETEKLQIKFAHDAEFLADI